MVSKFHYSGAGPISAIIMTGMNQKLNPMTPQSTTFRRLVFAIETQSRVKIMQITRTSRTPISLFKLHDRGVNRETVSRFHQDFRHHGVAFGAKDILHLHRFHHAQRLTRLHLLPLLNMN